MQHSTKIVPKMFLKSFNNFVLIILLIAIVRSISAGGDGERNHKKRQIYREEVLPHAGGRIPDTAFETDRLFLNRLQKEGISVPDGVVLEQRSPQVYPFQSRNHRTVFRIALSSDGRFISKEGRYLYNEVPSIETTYLYPEIHGQTTNPTPIPTTTVAYPVYRQIQLHNEQINQRKFQPKNKEKLSSLASKEPQKPQKTTSYQNFNIIHNNHRRPAAVAAAAAATAASIANNFVNTNAGNIFDYPFPNPNKAYLPSYETDNLLNEFDNYFNNFDLYAPKVDFSDFYNNEHTIDLPITGFSPTANQISY